MQTLCPVLGIDWGEARVGVAVSDAVGLLAHPLETIDAKKTDPVVRLAQIAREKGARAAVVGLPRNMDGSAGASSEKVREFAGKLAAALAPAPVHLVDERWSTLAASRALRAAGKKAKRQKGLIDLAAAQLILQTWLDREAFAGGV